LDCSEVYDLGTVVSLSAVPDEGSIFAGWTGNEDCTDGRLTANRALSCTATFDLEGGVRLKVTKVGTGTVTSSPAGIDCGADCSEDYAPGSQVTLTAKAGGDSAFAGWSGDADCNDGVVTMNFATSCTATFSGSGLRRLSVEKVGLGTGTVHSSPSGIACGADCEEDFATGMRVILTGKPAARAVLLGFKGDPDCSDAEVTMDAAKTCVGEFALGAALEVKKTGDGTGKVESDPAGIDCGSDCREVYLLLAKVKLTPTPDVGSRFAGWKGAPDCRDGVVALRSDLGCTAVFSPSEIRPRVAKLSIRKSGFGDGIVKSTPFGIECGTSCNHFFAVRTRVKLRPTPMPGSFFVGWKGHFDCLDGVVALRADRMCTAEFGSSKGARPARR